MHRPSVDFVCDAADEGWPSMDLVADMLPAAVEAAAAGQLRVRSFQPTGKRRLRRVMGRRWPAPIADRLIDRYVQYPRWIRRCRDEAGIFHVLDHSYAHLVYSLNPLRTIVTCHDLDAFDPLLDPARSPRPWWFRALLRRTFGGLQNAAKIVCVSEAVRRQLVTAAPVDPARTLVVPNGVHPAFTPRPDEPADARAAALLDGQRGATLDLLHVGLPVRRKRVDIALSILAALRTRKVSARLIRAGGALPPEMRALAFRLGVDRHVIELPFLPPPVLAAVYRRASVVILPSDAEGFGLPVLEALACGTPVVASDLPALRETGGEVARYRTKEDVDGWCDDVRSLGVRSPTELACWRSAASMHASRFTWAAAAERLLPLYLEISAA